MLGHLPAARPVPLEPYPRQFRFSRRRAGPNDPDRSRPTRRRWTCPRRTRARSADPRGHRGDGRGVRLGQASARAGRMGRRTATEDPGPVAPQRDRRRSGHRDRIPASLAGACPPRDPPGRRPGTRLEIVSRQTWCPSSPVLREHSLNHLRAGRFGDHPAVVTWARVQRPLPDRPWHRRGCTAAAPGIQRRPFPRACRWVAVVADGAFHQRSQLAAGQSGQIARRNGT
jgi:hypothetical protein